MSLRLPLSSVEPERTDSDRSSSDEEEEGAWDDWVSESGSKPCRSLFDEKTFPSATEAIAYDKTIHEFDLKRLTKYLDLDFHQRVRLINYIRKEKISSKIAARLTGSEDFFKDDTYLIPVIEDDKLLEYNDDDWSDSDNERQLPSQLPRDPQLLQRQISELSRKLALSNQALEEYREMMSKCLGLSTSLGSVTEESQSKAAKPIRDDDTHYFESYSETEIHSVMIQDTIRTSTYASFIFMNPEIFENAVVLDVGCGTGILSLFAATAGAAHVYAIDASEIAEKAEKIFRDNKMQDKITVIRGKVEDVQLPVQKVDIIISEWMGYALLYESMLDSVLHSRDRFLKSGGLVVPTESRMQLALCDAAEVRKNRIGFWEDVYGFDMSVMSAEVYDDAIIDVVPSESVLSAPHMIKDINVCHATPKELDFATPFKLVSTSSRKTKACAFLLYFDIIFNTSPDNVDPKFEVHIARPGEGKVAEVWPLGRGRGSLRRRASSRTIPPKDEELKAKDEQLKDPQSPGVGKVNSFSTGPMSIPTHWKQTVFLLREPIALFEGTVVEGTFHCRKSSDNSRELDVEIHYKSYHPDEDEASSPKVVQIYKVR